MFRPVSLYIGLRYTRAKRKNHFISLISLVSLIGIALGVSVLITILSVMNGFDKEIKQRVFSMVPAMTISSETGYITNWQSLQKDLSRYQYINASAPFVVGEVLLSYGGSVQPVLINGVLPNEENKIIDLKDKITMGSINDLKPKSFGILIGEALAMQLGAKVGEKITVITPQVNLSPVGVMPRFKRFTIIGIFKAGSGFGFDRGLGFIHLNDAQALLSLKDNVTGLHVKINDLYQVPSYANQLREELSPSATITTWADQFGEFFHAIKLEKTIMFFILLLIIAVAAFNLISTLIMVVSEKESDIAILRTFGATPGMIMTIFIFQGGMIGFLGTLLGVIGGVAMALNVTHLVNTIEHLLNIQFISSNVYIVDYLPSQLQWLDVLKISVISLSLSLGATIYPAWRAAKMDPVESLRYE